MEKAETTQLFFTLFFSLISFALRPPSLLKHVSRECNDEPLATEEVLRSTSATWMLTQCQTLCIWGCWGSWLMWLQGCPLSLSKKYNYQGRSLMTGNKRTSCPSSRIHWTAGQSPPPPSLEKWCSKSWKACLSRGRTGRSLQTAGMDLPRINHTDQPDCLLWQNDCQCGLGESSGCCILWFQPGFWPSLQAHNYTRICGVLTG